jgi:hypothetical protein
MLYQYVRWVAAAFVVFFLMGAAAFSFAVH